MYFSAIWKPHSFILGGIDGMDELLGVVGSDEDAVFGSFPKEVRSGHPPRPAHPVRTISEL